MTCWEYFNFCHRLLLLKIASEQYRLSPCAWICPEGVSPAFFPQALSQPRHGDQGELTSHILSVGTNIPLKSPLSSLSFSLLLHLHPGVWLGQTTHSCGFPKDLSLVKQSLEFSVSSFVQIWSGFFKWTEVAHP